MKKIKIVFGLMVLFFTAKSNDLHAQFFKQIINTVKNTSQNKANDKASQATDKAIDKVTTQKSGSNVGDTAATKSVLGAFAKAAADNPNDTSAADVTMKALGLLTGGGGVSAADSAAAIKNFMSAKGGAGYLFQYTTSTTAKKGSSKDTSSIYFTESGYGRSEMHFDIPGAMSMAMINIGHADQPKYSVSLYPESKTYSLNVIDTGLIGSNIETYKVTIIGNENLQGYNCIHVKMISSVGSGMFKSSSTTEVWTSKDVPGYALFKKMSLKNVTPAMMKALQQAGADGFIVKMQMQGKDYAMTMALTTAQQKSFPASMFQIPAGYTKSQYNMFYHMMSPSKK